MCVCVCVCNILFSHLSIDQHLGCFYVLPVVNTAAVNIEVVFSFSLDKYPEVELLDHIIVLFLNF